MWRLLGAATDWAAGRYKLSWKLLFVTINFKIIMYNRSINPGNRTQSWSSRLAARAPIDHAIKIESETLVRNPRRLASRPVSGVLVMI